MPSATRYLEPVADVAVRVEGLEIAKQPQRSRHGEDAIDGEPGGVHLGVQLLWPVEPCGGEPLRTPDRIGVPMLPVAGPAR